MMNRFIFLAFLLITHFAFAQAPSKEADATNSRSELNQAFSEAQKTFQIGPTAITLNDQAIFNLPAEYIFIPAKEAGAILRAMGNHVSPELQGIVFSQANDNWFAVVQFEKSGYIKDDDAKNWNIDELLTSIKDSTEETNKERKARSIPDMEIIGWVEKPHYDSVTRRLVWSIATKSKAIAGPEAQGINYNTYALGREGFFSLNLVTSLSEVEANKPNAQKLLAALEFKAGKRYTDFDPATDKTAAYGLAALVAGVAAKKLGLLAIVGIFLAKFGKIIGLAVIGVLGIFVVWFRRRKSRVTASDTK